MISFCGQLQQNYSHLDVLISPIIRVVQRVAQGMHYVWQEATEQEMTIIKLE